ncbi:hypothetical protein Tsubulata_005911 [Turnera subulata]|uniref:MATH domain-containing protein n=1 Tax=Turnera subulata TaxID=218843 RepID=A0A9Q0GAS7_9ROSI|nr:hypothetical protein Tsubulata_005911 [Turnera subulata]
MTEENYNKEVHIDGEQTTLASTNRKDAAGEQMFRKAPPMHYTVKIESFSLLLESGLEKYETDHFESGGHKWKLVLHPGKQNDKDGQVSLYLAVADPDEIPIGWEVNAQINFFVFDQIRDQYLIIPGNNGIGTRFQKMKTEWGLRNFISHKALRDISNGYLVDDCCVFGVEVFVIGSPSKGQTLSFVKQPLGGVYTWKVNNFSTLGESCLSSDAFTIQGAKWILQLYPNGDSRSSGNYLALFLTLQNKEVFPPGRQVHVHYQLLIMNQDTGKHYQRTSGGVWFHSKNSSWGFSEFILLSYLKNQQNGFLVNGSLTIQAEITMMSSAKYFS